MKSLAERDKILKDAIRLAPLRHFGAPQEHHAAFTNAVTYLVTGWSGGFGGPSMREHWAARFALSVGLVAGETDFDDAMRVVDKICYGPLTVEIARMMLEEHCFDDAPGEKEAAERLLMTSAV